MLLAPLALLLALNLVACGNKGPLVRPSADDVEDVDASEAAVDVEDDATTVDPETDPEAASDEADGEVPVDDGDEAGTPPFPSGAGNG